MAAARASPRAGSRTQPACASPARPRRPGRRSSSPISTSRANPRLSFTVQVSGGCPHAEPLWCVHAVALRVRRTPVRDSTDRRHPPDGGRWWCGNPRVAAPRHNVHAPAPTGSNGGAPAAAFSSRPPSRRGAPVRRLRQAHPRASRRDRVPAGPRQPPSRRAGKDRPSGGGRGLRKDDAPRAVGGTDERPVAWLARRARRGRGHASAAPRRGLRRGRAARSLAARGARSAGRAGLDDRGPAPGGGVTSCSRPFVIVLDNVELLRRGDASAVVLALAKSLPDGSVLALSGRTPPPLPIARLRAAGWVFELGTEELAFGRREAQLLVRDVGRSSTTRRSPSSSRGRRAGRPVSTSPPSLSTRPRLRRPAASTAPSATSASTSSPSTSRACHRSPSPFSAGRRCSVSCRGRSATRRSTRPARRTSSSGSRRQPLPRPARPDGRALPLPRPLPRGRRRELERHEPELVPMLHERAADWFEGQGDLARALDHALAGGDADRSARLLSALALRVYHDGRLGDLAVWLERFGAIAPLDEHPAAAVLAGWVHALAGRMHQAEQALAAAERADPEATLPDGTPVRPWIALLRATLCVHGVARMRRDVRARSPSCRPTTLGTPPRSSSTRPPLCSPATTSTQTGSSRRRRRPPNGSARRERACPRDRTAVAARHGRRRQPDGGAPRARGPRAARGGAGGRVRHERDRPRGGGACVPVARPLGRCPA